MLSGQWFILILIFFAKKTPFFKNAGSQRLLDKSWPKFYPVFYNMSTMSGKNLTENGSQEIVKTCLTTCGVNGGSHGMSNVWQTFGRKWLIKIMEHTDIQIWHIEVDQRCGTNFINLCMCNMNLCTIQQFPPLLTYVPDKNVERLRHVPHKSGTSLLELLVDCFLCAQVRVDCR